MIAFWSYDNLESFFKSETIKKMISRENLSEYDKNGYFFIKGFFSIDELQPLINETENFQLIPQNILLRMPKEILHT